jgi:hypothetical protein
LHGRCNEKRGHFGRDSRRLPPRSHPWTLCPPGGRRLGAAQDRTVRCLESPRSRNWRRIRDTGFGRAWGERGVPGIGSPQRGGGRCHRRPDAARFGGREGQRLFETAHPATFDDAYRHNQYLAIATLFEGADLMGYFVNKYQEKFGTLEWLRRECQGNEVVPDEFVDQLDDASFVALFLDEEKMHPRRAAHATPRIHRIGARLLTRHVPA